MNIVDPEDAEIFNPQKDLEFELVEEEEKGEEIIAVQKVLTLSQIRQRLASADSPYSASIQHLKSLNDTGKWTTPF